MGGGRIVSSLPSSLILFSEFMPGRLGTVAGCILLGGWGCEGVWAVTASLGGGREWAARDVSGVVQGLGIDAGRGGGMGVRSGAGWDVGS